MTVGAVGTIGTTAASITINFGINHIPRVEDFPVMPCEILKVAFKPVNFFDRNPAIDVPPSTQMVNRSTALNGGSTNGTNGHGASNGEAAVRHQQTQATAVVDGNGCCGGTNGTNGTNGHAQTMLSYEIYSAAQ